MGNHNRTTLKQFKVNLSKVMKKMRDDKMDLAFQLQASTTSSKKDKILRKDPRS